MDGNTAVATVAYKLNEVCAIYPITPSSTMAELADEWAAQGQPESLGQRAGRAGDAVGRRRRGRRARRAAVGRADDDLHRVAGPDADAARTCSRSPASSRRRCSMLRPARSRPRRCRSSATIRTSWRRAPPASRCSAPRRCRRRTTARSSAQAATLESRVPFLHFFDGFRTSHELNTLELLDDSVLQSMIDRLARARAPRARAEPGASVRARHRAQFRHVLPGARGGQPVLPCGPRHRREGVRPPRRTHGAALQAVRVRGRAGCRAGADPDGLGGRNRSRNGQGAGRRRRKSGRDPDPSVSTLLRRTPPRRAAHLGAPHRRARADAKSQAPQAIPCTSTWSPLSRPR